MHCAIIINFLCMPPPPHTPCTRIDVGGWEATLIKEFNILSPLKMYQQRQKALSQPCVTYVATNVTLLFTKTTSTRTTANHIKTEGRTTLTRPSLLQIKKHT